MYAILLLKIVILILDILLTEGNVFKDTKEHKERQLPSYRQLPL